MQPKMLGRDAVRRRLVEVGVVPVVRAASKVDAVRAVRAIAAGGIPVAEVTLTVPGALEVIAQLRAEHPDELLVGAGSVLDAKQAIQCLEAGAQFVVSPGLDVETVRLVSGWNVVMAAGALTPTEIIAAWRAGSDFVKVFPCGSMGGAKYLKAIRGPLPQIPLIPTGGVNAQNAAEMFVAGAAAIGVGGELVDAKALQEGRLDVITENARQLVAAVRSARHSP
ncbi:MAG: bifunctional 4-hydroxy-2-oxoglutarate aldolase/2-dehydro-3-deoxy-phosphogluconate aldolase [Myxococcota bacterium]